MVLTNLGYAEFKRSSQVMQQLKELCVQNMEYTVLHM